MEPAVVATDQLPRVDRRQRRRQETIEEVLDVAVAVMGEQGASGLSLGEVARRMDMRTPSLYGYFPSKHALYDAVFARGWREVGRALESVAPQVHDAPDLTSALLVSAEAFVRWCVTHPAYAQLMVWRPVPGYEPSAEAYECAVEVLRHAHDTFGLLRARGLLRADVALDQAVRAWTVLISGVVSQQMSNAPQEPYESGAFTTLLPVLVHMYARWYGAH